MWKPNTITLYLQMSNYINVKNWWDSLRCKYQLKQITKTREKNVASNENCILRKMKLKLQNPSFNILWQIEFWSKQKCWIKSWLYGVDCPGKITAYLVGQPWKAINFTFKKISYHMEPNQPAFIFPSQLSKPAGPFLKNANPAPQRR